ncbi:peptidase E, partial [Microbacterium aurum]|uniref:peptidase E n=1 Tax=Microbacterium aurum TaxID=36805 RepID=UPI001EF6E034
MRVYLSSYRMGARAGALRRRGGSALIVMNALDEFEQRLASWEREAGDLNELGYSSTELDLRDYWGASPTALRTTLSRADLIWVVGGNAFVLARAATRARLGLTPFCRSSRCVSRPVARGFGQGDWSDHDEQQEASHPGAG